MVKDSVDVNYEVVKSVVDEYYLNNGITDLMEYGSDEDRGLLFSLSDLYLELFSNLGVMCNTVFTYDVSDGKFVTRVELFDVNGDVSDFDIYTKAFNDKDIVINNIVNILI